MGGIEVAGVDLILLYPQQLLGLFGVQIRPLCS